MAAKTVKVVTTTKKNKNTRSRPRASRVVTLQTGSNNRRRASRANAVTAPLRDARVSQWDQLLRDPCAGPLSRPCYTGTDSGYLIRTTDYLTPTWTTATAGVLGATAYGSTSAQFTPFNLSSTTGLLLYYDGLPGGTVPPAFGFSNFIGNAVNPVVQRYRPVACCLKWIPNGPYATRAGTVGLGYNAGQVIQTGQTTVDSYGIFLACQHIVPNGSEPHEVRWLPTAVDETFTTTNAASNSGAGSVFCSLRGVDGVFTAAQQVSANGSFEITTVWEWLPNVASRIPSFPVAPLPYSSQDVLASVQDMSKYLFEGVRVGANRAMRYGMAGAGAIATQRLLTGGVQMGQTRAAAY